MYLADDGYQRSDRRSDLSGSDSGHCTPSYPGWSVADRCSLADEASAARLRQNEALASDRSKRPPDQAVFLFGLREAFGLRARDFAPRNRLSLTATSSRARGLRLARCSRHQLFRKSGKFGFKELFRRRTDADVERAELRIESARRVESHFVDQLFKVYSLLGEQVDTPVVVGKTGRRRDDL